MTTYMENIAWIQMCFTGAIFFMVLVIAFTLQEIYKEMKKR